MPDAIRTPLWFSGENRTLAALPGESWTLEALFGRDSELATLPGENWTQQCTQRILGRDSDTAGILGRHLDTRRPLSVQMSPENPRYVRMPPGDARRVRMSPDNAKRRDSASAAGHPRQRARPPRLPYPVKPGAGTRLTNLPSTEQFFGNITARDALGTRRQLLGRACCHHAPTGSAATRPHIDDPVRVGNHI